MVDSPSFCAARYERSGLEQYAGDPRRVARILLTTPMKAIMSGMNRTATHHVLTTGYTSPGTASTVGLISDGDALIVVDPGMVRSRSLILDPLQALGHRREDVTDVVFSHHHPDHTINAALFSEARIHDHWAIYKDDTWEWRDAEGYELTPSVTLIRTPGHTKEDITTLAGTSDGVVAFTHVWWSSETPETDPYATDPAALRESRARVREIAHLVVPGHGAAFVPSANTPA